MEKFYIDKEFKESMEMPINPFYSESNITYLEKIVQEIESREVVLREYELIEC